MIWIRLPPSLIVWSLSFYQWVGFYTPWICILSSVFDTPYCSANLSISTCIALFLFFILCFTFNATFGKERTPCKDLPFKSNKRKDAAHLANEFSKRWNKLNINDPWTKREFIEWSLTKSPKCKVNGIVWAHLAQGAINAIEKITMRRMYTFIAVPKARRRSFYHQKKMKI